MLVPMSICMSIFHAAPARPFAHRWGGGIAYVGQSVGGHRNGIETMYVCGVSVGEKVVAVAARYEVRAFEVCVGLSGILSAKHLDSDL